MRDDQRLVVGDVEYPVTRGADVVVGPGARHALPQRAVPRREMIDVAVAQRVPGMVFGQPRRVPATGTDAVMMVVLHWNKDKIAVMISSADGRGFKAPTLETTTFLCVSTIKTVRLRLPAVETRS